MLSREECALPGRAMVRPMLSPYISAPSYKTVVDKLHDSRMIVGPMGERHTPHALIDGRMGVWRMCVTWTDRGGGVWDGASREGVELRMD